MSKKMIEGKKSEKFNEFNESYFSDEEEFQDKKSAAKKKKIDIFMSDEDFKKQYNSDVLKKQTTLVLKTSFHLINLILMGMCSVFKRMSSPKNSESQPNQKGENKQA